MMARASMLRAAVFLVVVVGSATVSGSAEDGKEVSFPHGPLGKLQYQKADDDVPFPINVGTSRRENDVVEGGVLQQSYVGKEPPHLDENTPLLSMFVDLPEFTEGMYAMSKPIVFSQNDKIDVRVSEWYDMALGKLYSRDKKVDPLHFVVQHECLDNVEKGIITLRLQVVKMHDDEDSDDDTAPVVYREWVVLWVKSCVVDAAGGEEAQGSATTGFTVVQYVPEHPYRVIVEDGLTKPEYLAHAAGNEAPETPGTASLATLDPVVSLFVTSEHRKLTLQQAHVVVDDDSLAFVSRAGPLAGDETQLNPGVPRLLSVMVSCLKEGAPVVTVSFKSTAQQLFDQHFSYRVECAGPHVVEGAAIPGLNVGLAEFGNDIVSDGLTQPEYEKAASSDEEVTRPLFEDGVIFVTNVLSQERENMVVDFETPFVVTESSIAGQQKSVVRASLGGQLETRGRLEPSESLLLYVDIQCLAVGEGEVTVGLRLRPMGMLQFVLRKQCTEYDVVEEDDDAENPSSLPGLNVYRGSDAVVADGIVESEYHWSSEWDSLKLVSDKRKFVSFLVEYAPRADDLNVVNERFGVHMSGDRSYESDGNDSKAEDDDDDASDEMLPSEDLGPLLEMGVPEVFSSLAIMRPEFIGKLADGAELLPDEPPLGLNLVFHCFASGDAVVTVLLPWKAYSPSDRPFVNRQVALPPPTKLTLVKRCSPHEGAPREALGGIGVTGLSIGTQPELHDVVMDGFPQRAYHGQRNRDSPQWEGAMVDKSTSSITLYLHYDQIGRSQNLVVGDRLHFEPPSVIDHGGMTQARLSGKAAAGGVLQKSDAEKSVAPLELDVNFRCQWAGTAVVTVVIAFMPHGELQFSIPKECAGRTRKQNPKVMGFNIGTEQKKPDIVKDGMLQGGYEPYTVRLKGVASVIQAEGADSTVLWVQYAGAATKLEALEPVLYCQRPVCNPSLTHALHVQDSGDKEKNQLAVSFSKEWRPLTIDYGCTWGGVSPVTLTFDLLPVGRGRTSFTWLVSCPEDDDNSVNVPDHGGSFEGHESWYDSSSEEQDEEQDGEDGPGTVHKDTGSDEGDDDWSDYTWNYDHSEERSSESEEIPGEDLSRFEERYAGPGDHSRNSESANYLNVGFSAAGSNSKAVVFHNQPRLRFRRNSVGESFYVHPSRSKLSLFLSVDEDEARSQAFGEPWVIVEPVSATRQSTAKVKAVVSGSAASGGVVSKGKPAKLSVELQCVQRKGGYAKVLVVVPRIPSGQVSFRMVKLCPGGHPVTEHYLTAGNVLGLALVLVVAYVVYRIYRAATNKRSQYRAVVQDDAWRSGTSALVADDELSDD